MAGSLIIRRARLVLPDRVVRGDLAVADGVIEQIGPELGRAAGVELDGDGLTVLPGLIDTLVDVPFDEDGAALARVSGEAAAWGVTSTLLRDQLAPTVDADGLHARLEHAARHCRVHYGVYAVAHPDHLDALADLDRTPGVRAWLGGEGTHALGPEHLDALFAATDRVVVVEGGDGPGGRPGDALHVDPIDASEHSRLHPAELAAAVVRDTVAAARRRGGRAHVARISTAAELEILAGAEGGLVTGQATLPHLFLRAPDAYRRLGVRAVTDPPLRGADDVRALWAALEDGSLATIASGHGTIRAADKDVPYPRTPRALPTVGAMLPLLLHRVHEGRLGLLQVARLTAEGPARVFGLARTGRLEVGYDADIVLVDAEADASTAPPVPSWSGWSPLQGIASRGRVVATLLRGRPVYRDGRLVDGVRGRELSFPRT